MLRQITQPLSCTIGFHVAPSRREPIGPVVASCPCCGKTIYYYGLTLYGVGENYPSLVLPNFPRVLNALPPAHPHA